MSSRAPCSAPDRQPHETSVRPPAPCHSVLAGPAGAASFVAAQDQLEHFQPGPVELLKASWALGSLGIARLELSVTPANYRSRAVAERAGYVYEGTHRSAGIHEGQRFDKEIFSLLPDDPTQ